MCLGSETDSQCFVSVSEQTKSLYKMAGAFLGKKPIMFSYLVGDSVSQDNTSLRGCNKPGY